mmetsp:Transcript_67583/g.170550  ORF Transcript_67583/g.170550 Transcript_67583/m.170550 type:complete len:226 (-) Transcript_67583:136-813(-)
MPPPWPRRRGLASPRRVRRPACRRPLPSPGSTTTTTPPSLRRGQSGVAPQRRLPLVPHVHGAALDPGAVPAWVPQGGEAVGLLRRRGRRARRSQSTSRSRGGPGSGRCRSCMGWPRRRKTPWAIWPKSRRRTPSSRRHSPPRPLRPRGAEEAPSPTWTTLCVASAPAWTLASLRVARALPTRRRRCCHRSTQPAGAASTARALGRCLHCRRTPSTCRTPWALLEV